ncbi:molybdopterin-dependent oxidoreductase [Aliikangiella coralliicola]|uniref:Molybdopterin-dependent oxidoreductase n=1 Tax=Aliikangiella coralliicola TaxID=2592383 RepID=A0A545UJN1_9GAMM|nr:molybdopterin-dependent oxidoreductase [Aliikangiella coralliicola]TQV89662.1 molybdopterin-dependent oxidoreductase [Aliikangiella coralliicola]
MMKSESKLPPGQYESETFYRFGLTPFANRFPRQLDQVVFEITGDVAQPMSISEVFSKLPRVEQTSDFHCVTTWSFKSLRWSGVRFSEFYDKIVKAKALPAEDIGFVILRAQDGYRTCLPLADLLAEDVMLADQLNGSPLTLEHGAPVRLVAPAHYGYKNVKYICGFEFRRDNKLYRPSGFRFMDHPRARVAMEERAKFGPGWLFRFLYRPLVKPTVKKFQQAMRNYQESKSR